jgi:hypothetical protein
MPEFENYNREADELEREIARLGIALQIDWDDAVAVHALAREALAHHGAGAAPKSPQAMAKLELFGLTQLMLKVMRESAEENMLTHGGPVWKRFARALWAEAEGTGAASAKPDSDGAAP